MMMTRFVLTLLIGLVVSGEPVLAGQVIWEGYQTQKYSFFGSKRKEIQITLEGISVDGVFLSPDKLSEEEICAYGLTNFPKRGVGYIPQYGSWPDYVNRIEWNRCNELRSQFLISHDFQRANIDSNTARLTNNGSVPTDSSATVKNFRGVPDYIVCLNYPSSNAAQREAKSRGLTCGVGQSDLTTQTASASKAKPKVTPAAQSASVKPNPSTQLAKNWNLTSGGEKTKNPNRIDLSAYDEFRTLKFEIDGLSYDSYAAYKQGKNLFGFYAKGVLFYGDEICNWKSNITNRKTKSGSFEASCPSGLTVDGQYTYVGNKQGSYGSGTDTKGRSVSYVLGAAWSSSKYEIEQHYLNYFAPKPKADPAPANAASQSAELKAERQKRIILEQQLAALKAKQQKQKKTISNDTYIPLIKASSRNKDEATSIIFGTVTDDTGIASLTVAGEVVELAADGSFQAQTYVPASGLDVEIVAYDLKGNKASQTLSLTRKATQVASTQFFDKLKPSLGKRGKANKAALALIVGIEAYENFPAKPAIYADSDAQYFADYAHYKLGVPRRNIITAINADAEALDIRKAITKITRQSSKDKTDVFVFFAGHGLASGDESEDVYLLPYDGDKDYLAETSLTRSEVFKLVERIKPRSVTVFLDACYSGATRSEDKVLVADKRPVRLKVFEQAVPDGFTVLSAAAANETSMALEEAKHGLFSYYLMRGMEGDADTNQDNKITMNEMRDYVKDKVGRQSDFKQTPQLQGDANRVLVQFQ